MHRTLFLVTILFGLALAAIGLLLAPPVGPATTPAISNPRMPFAAGVFTLGVMIMFLSAVVYELVPSERRE